MSSEMMQVHEAKCQGGPQKVLTLPWVENGGKRQVVMFLEYLLHAESC